MQIDGIIRDKHNPKKEGDQSHTFDDTLSDDSNAGGNSKKQKE